MKVDRSLFKGVIIGDRINDAEIEFTIRHMNIDTSMKTCEMGCGNPIGKCFTYVLQQMGLEAWSCDPFGCEASQYLKHFTKTTFDDFVVPENYFDKVFDISAIHHFGRSMYPGLPLGDDLDIKASKKAYAILKSKGTFEISFDQFSNIYNDNAYVTRRYTYDKVRERLADSAGFTITEAAGYIIHEIDHSGGPHQVISVDWNDPRIQFAYFVLTKP